MNRYNFKFGDISQLKQDSHGALVLAKEVDKEIAKLKFQIAQLDTESKGYRQALNSVCTVSKTHKKNAEHWEKEAGNARNQTKRYLVIAWLITFINAILYTYWGFNHA